MIIRQAPIFERGPEAEQWYYRPGGPAEVDSLVSEPPLAVRWFLRWNPAPVNQQIIPTLKVCPQPRLVRWLIATPVEQEKQDAGFSPQYTS